MYMSGTGMQSYSSFDSISHTMQYTDAGIYTCSKGQRSHDIPGSYGKCLH